MSKKSKEISFEDVLERLYYFLKEKLSFDDIQAITMIFSIILLPISAFLGFSRTPIETFKIAFFITLGFDLIVIVYSIIKFKYFKNKRILFIKQFSETSIEVKDLDGVNKLNPIEFEYFVKEFFVRRGYKAWTTKRAYDNGSDVIADLNDERIAIQVKHSINSVNGYAIFQAVRGKDNYKADKAILVTNSELTNQAKLDAIRYNVEVIDGHDISKYFRKNKSIVFTKSE